VIKHGEVHNICNIEIHAAILSPVPFVAGGTAALDTNTEAQESRFSSSVGLAVTKNSLNFVGANFGSASLGGFQKNTETLFVTSRTPV